MSEDWEEEVAVVQAPVEVNYKCFLGFAYLFSVTHILSRVFRSLDVIQIILSCGLMLVRGNQPTVAGRLMAGILFCV